MTVTEGRLFRIKSYGDDFVTGLSDDGRQVVMGLLCPELVAYFFDQDGRLLGNERRSWLHPARQMGPHSPYQIYDDAFQEAIVGQLRGHVNLSYNVRAARCGNLTIRRRFHASAQLILAMRMIDRQIRSPQEFLSDVL